MDIKFDGKRALVTGAGKGIGRELAKALLRGGAETFALSRTKEDLDSLVQEEPNIHPVQVDLADWDLATQAVTAIGPIDLLVNNAAVCVLEPFLEVKPEIFDKMMNANVKQIINVSQVVAKGMIDRGSGGSIVNVSSQASQVALKNHASYCASKGAVDALTKVMALELGPHQIRVNTVNPTVVMTAMGKIGWSDPVKAKGMLDRIPLGHFAEVEDVVNAILYLLSDKSAMIHGALVPIDGGFWSC